MKLSDGIFTEDLTQCKGEQRVVLRYREVSENNYSAGRHCTHIRPLFLEMQDLWVKLHSRVL